jgi:hypothetical protein
MISSKAQVSLTAAALAFYVMDFYARILLLVLSASMPVIKVSPWSFKACFFSTPIYSFMALIDEKANSKSYLSTSILTFNPMFLPIVLFRSTFLLVSLAIRLAR